MNTYTIEVEEVRREIYRYVVEVDANTEEEAIDFAHEDYYNNDGECIDIETEAVDIIHIEVYKEVVHKNIVGGELICVGCK